MATAANSARSLLHTSHESSVRRIFARAPTRNFNASVAAIDATMFTADVDLVMTGPNKEKISDAIRSTVNGFHLDRDCPTDGCGGQNIENVYFDGLEPPKGKYSVEIRLSELHGADTPIKVRFGARVGSRTFGADVQLTRDDDKKTFSFEL